jgi:hypothetical protein
MKYTLLEREKFSHIFYFLFQIANLTTYVPMSNKEGNNFCSVTGSLFYASSFSCNKQRKNNTCGVQATKSPPFHFLWCMLYSLSFIYNLGKFLL